MQFWRQEMALIYSFVKSPGDNLRSGNAFETSLGCTGNKPSIFTPEICKIDSICLKTLNILLNSSISNLQITENYPIRLQTVIFLQVGQAGDASPKLVEPVEHFLLVRTGHNIYMTLSKSAHSRSPVRTADTLYFLLHETTSYVGESQGECSVSEAPLEMLLLLVRWVLSFTHTSSPPGNWRYNSSPFYHPCSHCWSWNV